MIWRPWRRQEGFVRHEFMLAIAFIGIVLAIAVPQYQKHGIKGVFIALVVTVAVVAAAGLLIWGVFTLYDRWKGRNWFDLALQWLGRTLLFLFLCCVGGLVVMPVALSLKLGPQEEWMAFPVPVLFGLGGTILHHRLGGYRFWPVFRRFLLALLCALPGAGIGFMAGISLFTSVRAHDWAITVGAMLPVAVFFVLLAMGRFIPPPAPRDEPATVPSDEVPGPVTR